MKIAGVLLLLAGWGIVLTAIAVLNPGAARAAFIVAGFGVQVMGLAVLIHSQSILRGLRR